MVDGSATAAAQIPAPTRCAVGIPVSEASGYVPLPRGDVFCPLLADPKGQRSFVSYIHETSDDGDMNVGSVGISDAFGLLRFGGSKPGNGFQVSLRCSRSSISMSSYDLTTPTTHRYSGHDAERSILDALRLYHQSSHLGDEFVLREDKRSSAENIPFEAVR
jgi:hypothetical protein